MQLLFRRCAINMSDSSIPPSLAALADLFPPDELLAGLLDVSLTGVLLFAPVYSAEGSDEVVDFAFVHLNPAAQRMLRMPARPSATFTQQFPRGLENGGFTFLRDTFLSGQEAHFELLYQEDQFDNYFRAAGRRVGAGLLLSVSDTENQPRTAVEEALRESQAREKAARAEAEAQRQELQALFMEAPTCIARLTGPEHTFTLANPLYLQLFGNRPLVGKAIRAALPELEGQPFFGLLDEVYRTGKTFYGNEVLAYVDQTNSGRLDPVYFNFIYQATHDRTGAVAGILIFAYDVSQQVLARQRLEANEQDLATINEEMTAANEELQAANHAAEQARAEAEASRQQLRRLLQQAPVSISYFEGPELVIALANPITCSIWGRLAEEVLGLPLLQALPELHGQGFDELLAEVFRTGVPFVGEEAAVRLWRNGQLEISYFNFVYQPLRNEQNVVVGVVAVGVDVTPQVLARRRLEESEQELAAINEELHAANEELQSTNEDLFQTDQQLRELNQELEARVQDRTHQLGAAQQEAERQRQRLERLFMEAPAAICILDGPEMVFELVNAGYQRLFPGRPLLGSPVLQVLPEITNHATYQMLRTVYETGITHKEEALLISFARPNEGVLEDRYFNFVQQARYNEQNQIDGVLVFASEVTAQVLAGQQVLKLNEELATINEQLRTTNRELGSANRQLTRTNQDLDNFVYAASHDLKQPVNNLSGLFDELRHAVTFHDPAEEQTLLALIADALRQLSTSINDLAALGQMQQAPQEAAETVRLADLTQEVLQTLQPQMRAAGARVTTDFTCRPNLHFSRPNLRTILLNLISNSLKYADPARPARIHVSVWVAEDGNPVLRVDDNGLGFDVDRHGEELFQLFRRFHTTHAEGTGVGLYLINRIVQANGGYIEVESEVGQGTTFRLFLRE